MSADNDIARFNMGLDEVFKPKPITHQPDQSIRDEEQKAAWQRKRTRRTHSDVYSMVCSYSHHDGDRQWLVGQLQTLPVQKREAVMIEYAKKYEHTKTVEQNENIKEGQARRAANSWLVAFMEQHNK